ncbi:hypothetical protein FZEAL_3561 [Fusarium zealandicum]|uniref:Uncharacterized protein n=1 Tax=Fusarium zealandicum TaxID=1053134 RepID=A0A8H4UPD1_9HYPO|nr:hypothetical protein FZEAL_3561 [Fusarium zealandicum]
MTMNFINVGFENEVKVPIDGHRMVVVANNGGFVFPKYTDAKQLLVYGNPMELSVPASPSDVCLGANGSIKSKFKTIEGYFVPLYPPQPPRTVRKDDRESLYFTFRLSAGTQPSQTEACAPEFYLNGKPW